MNVKRDRRNCGEISSDHISVTVVCFLWLNLHLSYFLRCTDRILILKVKYTQNESTLRDRALVVFGGGRIQLLHWKSTGKAIPDTMKPLRIDLQRMINLRVSTQGESYTAQDSSKKTEFSCY